MKIKIQRTYFFLYSLVSKDLNFHFPIIFLNFKLVKFQIFVDLYPINEFIYT